jgi:hypothetical protein
MDSVFELLRRPLRAFTSKKFDAEEMMAELVGDHPKKSDLTTLGRGLADLVHRHEPFTPAYFYNWRAGTMKIGAPLRDALRAYWMAGNGVMPPYAGAFQPIQLKALNGNIEPGSYVLAGSVRCGHRACNTPFVPVTPNQLYCCAFCRKQEASERKKDAKTKTKAKATSIADRSKEAIEASTRVDGEDQPPPTRSSRPDTSEPEATGNNDGSVRRAVV